MNILNTGVDDIFLIDFINKVESNIAAAVNEECGRSHLCFYALGIIGIAVMKIENGIINSNTFFRTHNEG